MHFSLRTLLVLVAGVSIVAASLMYPAPTVGDFYYAAGLLIAAFAILAVIYIRGPRRTFWIGFLLLFAGYYAHSVWPSELRSTWNAVQRIGMGYSTQGLPTTRLLGWAFDWLHPTIRQAANRPGGAISADEFVAFMTIGHTMFALLFGVCGGVVAQWLAKKATSKADAAS